MTKNEKELLDQLKDFFTNKYGKDGWLEKFKKYTIKLVNDNHLDQEVIDEYLLDIEPDEIVKKFHNYLKNKQDRTVKSSDEGFPRGHQESGCGGSYRFYGGGCGGSRRSYC